MPRSIVATLLICCLLILTVATPAQPQAVPEDAAVAEKVGKKTAELDSPQKRIDFKKAVEEETRKFNAESGKFDPVKIDLENAKKAQKKGWTKTEKTVLVVFAVGITVLVWFLIKYGKECIETTPRNCSLNVDENCYCERYKEDNANRAVPR